MTSDLVFLFLAGTITWLSLYKKKLTSAGAITGVLIAVSIYMGCGLPGVTLLGCFFIAGTLATSWNYKKKWQLGLAEANKGRRNIFQVLANGLLAGLLGFIAFILPQYRELLLLMLASGLSAATADTLSSELGTLYGKHFYNIVTLARDKRGENGVVSVQGTLCGVAGSSLIALCYFVAVGWQWEQVLIIIAAGTAGNLFDSFLGATIERDGKIGNNLVNFLNTICGALVALGFKVI